MARRPRRRKSNVRHDIGKYPYTEVARLREELERVLSVYADRADLYDHEIYDVLTATLVSIKMQRVSQLADICSRFLSDFSTSIPKNFIN